MRDYRSRVTSDDDDNFGVRSWRMRPRCGLVVEPDDAAARQTRRPNRRAVALPSCGETGDTLRDLYDDVQACRKVIAEVGGPVVLCGHSYGGMIITEAGADDRVTQLLYVTSVMPDAGQSQADLIGSEPAPWLRPDKDGTCRAPKTRSGP